MPSLATEASMTREVENELHQCPCDSATKCKMAEPCLGCETYSKWETTEVEAIDYAQSIFLRKQAD